MKIIKYLIPFLFLLLLSSCGSSTTTVSKRKGNYTFQKKPNHFYFTILQLNDVYEIAPIQGGKYGGLARVETIHKQLLQETPNTMLVMAGDFLNPSLLGTLKHNGERIKGKQMVEVMNAMNFDLAAFGNHEFDLKYNQLQERLNESDFDWVSANVLHNKNGQAHYFYKIKGGKKETVSDSYIKKFYQDGQIINVGFISVCIDSNPKDYVTYGDVYIEAERSYNEVESQSDIVLGLTHLKLDQDKKLASMLPNIPLIMGGHEHNHSFNKIGNVTIAKADANAKTVYIHRFEYNLLTKETKLKSELLTIDDSIKEDPFVGNVVNKWQQILDRQIKSIIKKPNEVIYKTKIALDGRDTPIRSKQTNLGTIVTKAMSFGYKNIVDCAIVNGGSIRIDDMLKGAITPIDIFRVLPFGGSVKKAEVKGSLLEKVLDFGENAKGTGAYLQRFNAVQKSGVWYINNEPIQSEKIYTIACSDYLLKGYDIPFFKASNPDVIAVYDPTDNELTSDIRKVVISYLKDL